MLPLFLVDRLPHDDRLRLDGAEGRHAAAVQRLRVGERLLVADGRGGTAEAVVAATGRDWLDLAVQTRTAVPAPAVALTVVQGIPKGDRGELAVATMTEVGVDRIVPWAAARSIARWKDDRGLDRWRATAREATKQSRRAWVPEVVPAESTRQVASRLTAVATADPMATPDAGRGGVALVLHEAAAVRLASVELPERGEVVLVVGPEGGVDDAELAAFEAAGAVPVRLGDTVLRTSTAGAAAIAALSPRLGRW